jgi:hypothetical protein
MVEQRPVKALVVGSSPTPGARYPITVQESAERAFRRRRDKYSITKDEFGKHSGRDVASFGIERACIAVSDFSRELGKRNEVGEHVVRRSRSVSDERFDLGELRRQSVFVRLDGFHRHRSRTQQRDPVFGKIVQVGFDCATPAVQVLEFPFALRVDACQCGVSSLEVGEFPVREIHAPHCGSDCNDDVVFGQVWIGVCATLWTSASVVVVTFLLIWGVQPTTRASREAAIGEEQSVAWALVRLEESRGIQSSRRAPHTALSHCGAHRDSLQRTSQSP